MKNLYIILGSLILASCSSGPSSSDVDMLATGEINEIICEEECVIEGVNLKNVQLESVNLKNISFQNSYFENVTIKGSQDKFSVLDNIKFIDSEINNLSIEDFVVTYDPSNFDLVYLEDAIKKECEYWEAEAWKDKKFDSRREECRQEAIEDLSSNWKLDYTDFKNWRNGIRTYAGIIVEQLNTIGLSTDNAKNLFKDGMSIHFENVTGSIHIKDIENSFISSKLSNSSLNVFEVDIWKESFVFLNAYNSNFKNLSYWHSGGTQSPRSGRGMAVTYSVLNSISNGNAFDDYPTVSLVDSKIERLNMLSLGDNGLACENSEFEGGNLFLVVTYCPDMGINFDEFAYRDFDKSFIPDNTVYSLQEFTGTDYSNVYAGRRIEGFDRQASNKSNQLYAIASGDGNFLMSYLDGLYKYMLLEDKFLHESKSCGNDHSLLWFDWSNAIYSDNPCDTERTRLTRIGEWNALPNSFRTKIDDKTQEFVDILTSSDKEVSKKDKELFLTNFVKNNHDFSNFKNCLRTREVQFVRDTLKALYQVPPRSSPYYDRTTRQEKATRARMQERASNLVEIQDFKECIENNIEVYGTVIETYSPIQKLATLADPEIKNFRDEKERQRILAERKRREEREKLFASFVKNNQDLCAVMATSMGSQIINMYYSGSTESKIARTKYAYNACNRCNFNFWSNMLNDDDFLKLANGDRDNMTTDMSSFGYADVKKMMMCPVAGADAQVQREYALMMQ